MLPIDRRLLRGAVWDFEAVALFGQFSLQGGIDEGDGNFHVADFELGGIERRVAILFAHVAGDGHPDVFSANFSEELAVDDVAVHGDLLVFDVGHAAADIGVGRKIGTASGGSAKQLRQRGADAGIRGRIRLSVRGSGAGGLRSGCAGRWRGRGHWS